MKGIDTRTEKALKSFYNEVLKIAYPSLTMEIEYIDERQVFTVGRSWKEVSYSCCPVVILEDGVKEIINIDGCSLSCIIEDMMVAIARIYDENRTLAYCRENREKANERDEYKRVCEKSISMLEEIEEKVQELEMKLSLKGY